MKQKRWLAVLGVLALLLAWMPVPATAEAGIAPGGMPFGVKLFTRGVVVVGVTDVETDTGARSPAREAGMEKGDVILRVDGETVDTAEQLGKMMDASAGKELAVEAERCGEAKTFRVSAALATDGRYKSGLWVRDSTAGIGTVTFIRTDSGEFGGLGHGICDGATENLMPLQRGVVVDVTLTGITRGRSDAPGELRGELSAVKKGNILANTECGVFGVLDAVPAYCQPMAICPREELHTGSAFVLTTVEGTTPRLYEIEIVRIADAGGQTRNFVLEITDPVLLEKTGGIVQGMSGSPVIQDGRFAGAVTHVMISDPKRGYGIFIENMLDAA